LLKKENEIRTTSRETNIILGTGWHIMYYLKGGLELFSATNEILEARSSDENLYIETYSLK